MGGSKYKMTYIRPNIYINKLTSPIFNSLSVISEEFIPHRAHLHIVCVCVCASLLTQSELWCVHIVPISGWRLDSWQHNKAEQL